MTNNNANYTALVVKQVEESFGYGGQLPGFTHRVRSLDDPAYGLSLFWEGRLGRDVVR